MYKENMPEKGVGFIKFRALYYNVFTGETKGEILHITNVPLYWETKCESQLKKATLKELLNSENWMLQPDEVPAVLVMDEHKLKYIR